MKSLGRSGCRVALVTSMAALFAAWTVGPAFGVDKLKPDLELRSNKLLNLGKVCPGEPTGAPGPFRVRVWQKNTTATDNFADEARVKLTVASTEGFEGESSLSVEMGRDDVIRLPRDWNTPREEGRRSRDTADADIFIEAAVGAGLQVRVVTFTAHGAKLGGGTLTVRKTMDVLWDVDPDQPECKPT